LLEIVKDEIVKFPTKSEPKFRGNTLHVEVVEDNLEISLNVWDNERKFLPLHAAMIKTGLIELKKNPDKICPKFPIIKPLTAGLEVPTSWGLEPGVEEFFFRLASPHTEIGYDVLGDRKSETNLIQSANNANFEHVFVQAKVNSNFDRRSGLVWRPEVRWTDSKGAWEMLKLHRL
jgi:hypothetical protein